MKSRAILPTRKSSNWLVGWKTANLVISPATRKIGFLQVYQFKRTRPYNADDIAICLRSGHPAPDYECRCGFNAFHNEEHARAFMSANQCRPTSGAIVQNPVILRVGLYGKVIEGTYMNVDDWGYKAERQRVANVFLPTICGSPGCSRDALWLGVLEHDWRSAYQSWNYLRPLCVEHVIKRGIHFSIEQCTDILKVSFLWDGP